MKTKAILNNRRLKELTTVFRFMETFFFLAMISRFSYQLPSVVKLTGDYFRESSFSIFSPKFVFVIGNIIVLILFLRSRVVENKEEIGNADLCYEYVKTCNRNCTDENVVVSSSNSELRICRSKSEDPVSVHCREHRKLRRSVTEIRKPAVEKSKVTDDQSCEDFRRTVEAFIARRQKTLRDEEL
ncbi:uncharacterized protein LOC143547144 [Bidens hawaiensis]|uniref:uncharacterized protein LOC143547144 n=1 Tax=Bidens hawaiensis TaxID=980011 RepID=UPI00404B0FFD